MKPIIVEKLPDSVGNSDKIINLNPMLDLKWISVGILTNNLYLRGGLTYGIAIPSKDLQNAYDHISKISSDYSIIPEHGLELKIAIGYRFF